MTILTGQVAVPVGARTPAYTTVRTLAAHEASYALVNVTSEIEIRAYVRRRKSHSRQRDSWLAGGRCSRLV